MPNNDDKRNAYPAERRTETTVKKTVCAYTSLLNAEPRCHRGVGYKNSVSKFHMLVMSKCIELHNALIDETYHTEYGEEFEIYEPKYRIVTSTKYKDRIPQTSFVLNYYYKEIIPRLIDRNFACLKGRGVDVARNTFKDILQKAEPTDYVLKADLKNYFGSIEHEKLIAELKQYIRDEWAIKYYADVINCNDKPYGIGLGSEINQLSATTFTNKLDHMLDAMKHTYEKYMDDFTYVGTKAECEYALSLIYEEASRLNLTVSKNKTYIQPISKPIRFLGFTFLRHDDGKVTLKRIKQKRNNERRKLRRMKEKSVPFERVLEHFNAVMAVYKKGSRSGYIKMWRYFNELFKEEIDEFNKKEQCSGGNEQQKERFAVSPYCRTD